jgi:hypothetical protein
MYYMKTIFTLLFTLVLVLSGFAQTRPVNKAIVWYGDWSNKNSWSLGRVPKDGDSVVIADGRAIVVDKTFTYKELYLNVTGNNSYIHLKGKLNLDKESTVELGNGSRIMAFGANRNNETISIGGVRKYGVNDNFNLYGYGIANKNTGASPNGFSTSAALPVQFTSFVVTQKNDQIQIKWSTAQEKDNSHFEVEKSVDGRNWTAIAVVFGNGTSNLVHQYSYITKAENTPVVYYRIRQVDVDGSSTYTSIRTISADSNVQNTKIYTSSAGTITIDLTGEVKPNLQVTVVNMNGQVLLNKVYQNASYRITVPINSNSKGIYVVKVGDNSGWSESKKVVL